jgi:hypothetical protein
MLSMCLWILLINFWRPQQKLMKLDIYIYIYMYYGTWAHLNGELHRPSHQAGCLCIPPIVARQQFSKHVPSGNDYTQHKNCWTRSFLCGPCGIKRKVRDSYFPELFVFYNVWYLTINKAVFPKLFNVLVCKVAKIVITESPLHDVIWPIWVDQSETCTAWLIFNIFCECTYVYEGRIYVYIQDL